MARSSSSRSSFSDRPESRPPDCLRKWAGWLQICLSPVRSLRTSPRRVSSSARSDALHRVADERLVEDDLLAGQPEQVVGLGLVGQLGGDAGVGLAPPQQERADQAGELPRLGRLEAGLDRAGPDLAERLAAAEQAGRRPVEDRPELGQVVLDRGAGEGDPGRGRDRAQRAGRGGAGVLDVLRLVGDDQPPGDGGQRTGVAPDGAVGGEHEAGVGHGVGGREVVERALTAVEAAYVDTGGEAPDLGLPVAEERGGADHQGRPWPRHGPVEVEGDQGDRLAQTHVVGQAGAEPERGDALEPGEPLALVVAQHGREPGRGRERGCGRGVEELLADLEQAGSDDDLGGGVVDVDDAGQRRRHGLRRLHRADQAAARLAGDRRVDDGPAAAQPEHRRRRLGQRVHLGLGERLSAQCDLPVEGEQRVTAEHALDELALAPGRHAVEGGGGLEVAAQTARPEHVDATSVKRLDAVLEEADQVVGGERHLVGDPLLEQALEGRPGRGGLAQGQRGVGAGTVAEAVHRGRVVPQRAGVADVERVLLVVHLQHQPARSGDELLLVGLDPEREGHQLGQAGALAPMAGHERLEAPAEGVALGPGCARRWRLGSRRGVGRGRARHGVDDGVDQPAYDVLGVGRGQPGVGPRLGQPPQPLGVVGDRAGRAATRRRPARTCRPPRTASPAARPRPAGSRRGGPPRRCGPWPAPGGRPGSAG